MFVWKNWSSVTYQRVKGGYKYMRTKSYKLLLLFGIIPLYISING